MNPATGAKLLLSVALAASSQPSVFGSTQVTAGELPVQQSSAAPSGLEPAFIERVQHAVDVHDYATAERLLLDEINLNPHSRRAAALLAWIGSIYLENHDAMSAAVAWNKSNAIVPLDAKLQFSLAMAYVSIKHTDWARQQLEKLAAADPANALYVYWLGRIDYDGHLYPSALRRFQQAIALDPTMARAYDNLGLVYYYQNQNAQAVESFRKAIELDRSAAHPSPWPYLNLAITEQFLNEDADAEAHLREAIRLDAALPQAHFQLGTVLEDGNRLEDAVAELKQAAQLDAAYAEPHMALARVYHKLGQEVAARDEVQIYKRLHTPSAPQK